MELGIYSFGDITTDGAPGEKIAPHQRMRDLIEEIRLADEVGLDVFALGEHHRKEYLVSSPAVVLAAAAERTRNIRLSSAVTVLSSDDPVRVFQDFATIDLLSAGRAEIMAGRGSFIESFPLFGYNLDDYDELFNEKLGLLVQLNQSEIINWEGQHRPSIKNLGIYPRPYSEKIPIWVAVGGTPASVVRAARHSLPMALAIIGGLPERFAPLVDLYREAWAKAGNITEKAQISINSHVFIADDSRTAADVFYPPYAASMSKIGRERGWQPMSRPQYDAMRGPKGSLLVGSPAEITDKILYEYELFANTRFLAQMSVGLLPHKTMMRSIELFGTQVAPAVRKSTVQ